MFKQFSWAKQYDFFKPHILLSLWANEWEANIIEPRHEISNNVVCVTSKASDQPAHTCNLIKAFACLSNILLVLSYWLNIIWSF